MYAVDDRLLLWNLHPAWQYRFAGLSLSLAPEGPSIFAPATPESRFVHDTLIQISLCQILPGGRNG